MYVFIFSCLCSCHPNSERIFFLPLSLYESLAISTNYLESHLSGCLALCISAVPYSLGGAAKMWERPGAISHSGVSFSGVLVGVQPHLPLGALQGCCMSVWSYPGALFPSRFLTARKRNPLKPAWGKGINHRASQRPWRTYERELNRANPRRLRPDISPTAWGPLFLSTGLLLLQTHPAFLQLSTSLHVAPPVLPTPGRHKLPGPGPITHWQHSYVSNSKLWGKKSTGSAQLFNFATRFWT